MYENDGKQFQQDKETGPSPNIEKKTCANTAVGSPWSWMACMRAPLGPPQVPMQLSSVRKLLVLPPQPPYEKSRQREAVWSK